MCVCVCVCGGGGGGGGDNAFNSIFGHVRHVIRNAYFFKKMLLEIWNTFPISREI